MVTLWCWNRLASDGKAARLSGGGTQGPTLAAATTLLGANPPSRLILFLSLRRSLSLLLITPIRKRTIASLGEHGLLEAAATTGWLTDGCPPGRGWRTAESSLTTACWALQGQLLPLAHPRDPVRGQRRVVLTAASKAWRRGATSRSQCCLLRNQENQVPGTPTTHNTCLRSPSLAWRLVSSSGARSGHATSTRTGWVREKHTVYRGLPGTQHPALSGSHFGRI